jgi:putative membrane protein
LLSLGVYSIIVEAISTSNPAILLSVGGGICLGIPVGIKLIKMLLKSYAQMMYCAILGLVIGSIFIIYPGFSLGVEGGLSVVFAFGFAVLTIFLSRRESAKIS